MSKIQLKNVGSMDEFASGAPVMQSSYTDDSGLFDDSGFWNESGWWDDSGDYDVRGGYEYIYANITDDATGEVAISVRIIALWTSGNLTWTDIVRVHACVDDGFNPYISGTMGEPIVNYMPDKYKFERADVYNGVLIGSGTSHSFTVTYSITYRYDKNGNVEENGKVKFFGQSVIVNIPQEYYTVNEEEE